MAEASIPVDLLNPGQVFACLGFLEAADVLLGNARGAFDWTDEADVRFRMSADGERNPFGCVVSFLLNAKAHAVSPSQDIVERDGGETRCVPDIFPCRFLKRDGEPRNALLPIELSFDGNTIRFDYWCDLDSQRPLLRLWTATNGNSAWVRFGKLRDSLATTVADSAATTGDPFGVGAAVAANFRLELRRNWVSLDLGFSPDRLNKGPKCVHVDVVTYPLVELLAAFGLSHARPIKTPGSELVWSYAAWSDMLPPQLARPAIARSLFRSSDRRFRMLLEQPNDGGDLSIANAIEGP